MQYFSQYLLYTLPLLPPTSVTSYYLHGWSLNTHKHYLIYFGVLFVPLAYFMCFMCYWLIIRLRCIKRAALYLRARLFPNMELTPLLDSQQEPDRLENPERYE